MKSLICLLVACLLVSPAAATLRADINSDGRVDLADLAILSQEWLCMSDYHIKLNNTAGLITVNDNNTLDINAGSFTLCFWAKTDYQMKIEKPSFGAGGFWRAIVGVDGFSFNVEDEIQELFSVGTFYSPLTFTKTDWNHFCMVLDRESNTIKLYVNAVTDITAQTDITDFGNQNNNSNMVIVPYSSGGQDPEPSYFDDLRIYDKAITDAQITQIYNATIGRKYTGSEFEGGVAAAAWNMDEGTGTTITDTVNDLVGTFSGPDVEWIEGGVPFVELGILTDIEDWAILKLKAMTERGDSLFLADRDDRDPSVDHWLDQIGAANSGVESFDRFAPFAFVSCELGRTKREGGYDPNIQIFLDIIIGQKSDAPGICRTGDTETVGANRMFEKVFFEFDGKHPGYGITCDSFFLNDVYENISSPKRCGLQLRFAADWIAVSS